MRQPSDTIAVSVKLPGMLARFRPDPDRPEPFTVELADGSTVGDLVSRLNIPSEIVKLVFVDYACARATDVFAHGSRVEIFPPIAGG